MKKKKYIIADYLFILSSLLLLDSCSNLGAIMSEDT